MDQQPPILLSVENSIATITLNRPERFNAFNRPMALLLQDVLETCKTNPEIRAVVITGAGKAFSAGQDVKELTDPDGPKMNRILSEHFNPIVKAIRYLEKPVVAAVNGVAAGAGASIAINCDIVVAAEEASFIQSFINIGLIPDSAATFLLPRLIGWQRAQAQMMLGEPISATEAAQIGMIYKAVPGAQLHEVVAGISAKLAASPTKAIGLMKTALRWSFSHTFNEQLENEDKLQQRAAATQDFAEGIKAFVEKRAPNFLGE